MSMTSRHDEGKEGEKPPNDPEVCPYGLSHAALMFQHANLHIIYYMSAKDDQNIFHGIKKMKDEKLFRQTISSFIFEST